MHTQYRIHRHPPFARGQPIARQARSNNRANQPKPAVWLVARRTVPVDRKTLAARAQARGQCLPAVGRDPRGAPPWHVSCSSCRVRHTKIPMQLHSAHLRRIAAALAAAAVGILTLVAGGVDERGAARTEPRGSRPIASARRRARLGRGSGSLERTRQRGSDGRGRSPQDAGVLGAARRAAAESAAQRSRHGRRELSRRSRRGDCSCRCGPSSRSRSSCTRAASKPARSRARSTSRRPRAPRRHCPMNT